MLPIVRIPVWTVPSFDYPDRRIELADPVRPDMKRNRGHRRFVDYHNQFVDLLQRRLDHELMSFMQRGKLPQR
ncbi:hypothetical protein D3C78_1536880 [compost metagenome]